MSEAGANTETATGNSLDKLATRIWEHPLVTDLTRRKRSEAIQAASEIVGDDKDILLIPVGSSVWVTEESSDVDFFSIKAENFSEERFREIDSLLNADPPPDNKPLLEHAGWATLGDEFIKQNMAQLATLFLVPDEYIVGDHDFLKALRVKALNAKNYNVPIKNSNDYFEQTFKRVMEDELRHIKGWPMRSFGSPKDKRYGRWMQAFDSRAGRSNDPNRWRQGFYNSLKKLEVPEVATMRSNLQATGGEIHITNRYRAQAL